MIHLILCGLPASGKSYFARKFSSYKKCKFADLDILVKHRYKMTPREVFNKLGEETLRKFEGEILLSSDLHFEVLALGGGTLMNNKNVIAVKKLGPLVYLKADYSVVEERLMKKKQRPAYLKNFNELISQRIGVYEKYADFTLDLSNLSDFEILQEMDKIYGQ